jgi:hypothetical protein
MLKKLLFCTLLSITLLKAVDPEEEPLCFCLQNGLRITTDRTFEEVSINDFASILTFLETEYNQEEQQATCIVGTHLVKLLEEGGDEGKTITLSRSAFIPLANLTLEEFGTKRRKG